ncbi:tetratricopeptide repeat protein [Endozoicomonas sp. ALD040]|uniref:tetratricopeptide repeat protein n=1 Tax=Endozoicomonas sp. ALD040 TaxID=3403079 RepID=UPI003BB0AFC6
MSYGPTPTTSAPASSSCTTSQSSPYCASGSYADAARNRQSTSNREIKSLTQSAQLPQVVHQRSTSPSDISGRQASACQPATTSQPSGYCASGSDTGASKGRRSTLNPNAKTFIPRSQLPHGGHQDSNRPSRPATADQSSTLQTFHPEAKTCPPEVFKKEIKSAYAMLNNQNFIDAEKAFRTLLNGKHGIPSRFDKQEATIGLARSLREQTHEKQLEACSILEELRLDGKLTRLGASTISNLDLCLSLCEEALGRHLDAETRLLRLRKKMRNANERALCEPSHYYAADISNARLWQLMGKYTLAETLLLNLKTELIKNLQSKPYSPATSKLRRHLDTVNMALMRLWQLMGKHQKAELLMLDLIGKRPDDDEDILCRQSDHKDVDLALTFIWRALGKHKRAERLLLNMSRKHPDDSEEILCRPTGHRAIDMALMRTWDEMNKPELAEKLLLNMSGKRPGDSEEELCKPCGHHDIDLSLALIWQRKYKYIRTEKLLLSMSGKRPGDSEEELCKPCGHHDIDLSLALLWQRIYKYIRTEKLLLNMSGKRPGDSEEELCKLCGNRESDLALVRFWELTGRYTLAEKLLLNMSRKHPDASEEILCKPCWQHDIDLALVRCWQLTGKYKLSERLLLNMIGWQPNDSEEIPGKSGGHDVLYLALARLWEMMDKPERTERLLLNISGKHPGDDEDSLCKPSGNHDIDLTLARCWENTGKLGRAERLLKRGCEFYHSNEFELTLLKLLTGQEGFMEMVSYYPESANTLVAKSIHYFSLACEQIIQDNPESGQDNLHKALEFVELALKKYPPIAGAFSQKAHCLRMLGKSEQEWREWFDRAEASDSSRTYRAKTHLWRNREAAALQKLSNLKE